jgi:TetR/AcrR family fatty acid metabolism transcriptional regulator
MNGHSARGASSEKRARILESAERVFASKGFFGSKVADIAADAGVADGTIYLYFRSKDDLLISVFEEQMAKVNEALQAAIRGGKDAVEKLRGLIRTWVGLVEAHPRATEVITLELRQSAKFMKEYSNPRFADFLKIIASVIDEGQKAGLLRADVPAPVAARGLFGLMDELALMWVTARGETLDISKLSDWVSGILLDGIMQRSTAK